MLFCYYTKIGDCMKSKKITISYWAVTIIFCLANLLSGISGFFPNEQSAAVMALLGYPGYLLLFIGVGKILGSVALLQTKFRTIKEWAYAGFTIDYLSASASFYIVNGGFFAILFPLIFLAIMFVSYWLWKKNDSAT